MSVDVRVDGPWLEATKLEGALYCREREIIRQQLNAPEGHHSSENLSQYALKLESFDPKLAEAFRGAARAGCEMWVS